MTTQNRKLAATARALAINGKKPAFASSAWRVPAIKLRTICLLYTSDHAYIISGLRKEPRVLVGRAGLKLPFFEQLDKL